jgi:DNA adenine methylase
VHRNAPISPFRYPGGKGALAPTLAAAIGTTSARIYVEPYAGGAAAAWKLLRWGCVDRIVLNDFDRRIYAAWKAMLDETDRFIDRILSVETSVETWRAFAETVKAPATADLFELGFATFFLNRTNRSGIVIGAAPIGGYDQSGTWKIDARFTRDTLVQRVRWIGSQRERVKLLQVDGRDAIKATVAQHGADKTFFFIDPPYVGAGSRLYLNTMKKREHAALARAIKDAKLK